MPTVPEQNPERRRDPADQLLAKRLHHRPVTLHDPRVWRGSAQPLLHLTRERFELRHERGAVRPRLHARHHARPEPAWRDLSGANRQRHPERDALIGEAELRLHDADHLPVLPREKVALADHLLIGLEPVLPQPVAQDDDAAVVLVGRQPPMQGHHAKRREERRRSLRHEELVDLTFGARRRRSSTVNRGVLDSGHALAVCEVQLVRNAELLGLIRPWSRPADMDEPVRIRERQRLQEHHLDDAEDRSVRSDGEGERHHDGEREARRAGKIARRAPEVPDPRFHRTHPSTSFVQPAIRGGDFVPSPQPSRTRGAADGYTVCEKFVGSGRRPSRPGSVGLRSQLEAISKTRERASRDHARERVVGAARERACRGVRGAKPLG